jgi:streptomycin 6-kinase
MSRPPVRIPSGLRWWRTVTGGAAWLERLPDLVEECATLWRLELEPSFEQAHVSFVAPARLPDGTAAVLKVNFPEPESEREADALALWNGDGAVRLLAEDLDRRALLVERCEPGATLWAIEDEDEANEVAADILRRLWRPPPAEHRFSALADEASRWAEELPARWERHGRPFERRLLEEAVDFLREAVPRRGEEIVVHQDLHGGNILRSARQPWLAIDPKPLVAEREFDVASLLRDRRSELGVDPRPVQRIRRRLDLLENELGLDRERMRGWGVAHALAWGVNESVVLDDMVACARWLAAAR